MAAAKLLSVSGIALFFPYFYYPLSLSLSLSLVDGIPSTTVEIGPMVLREWKTKNRFEEKISVWPSRFLFARIILFILTSCHEDKNENELWKNLNFQSHWHPYNKHKNRLWKSYLHSRRFLFFRSLKNRYFNFFPANAFRDEYWHIFFILYTIKRSTRSVMNRKDGHGMRADTNIRLFEFDSIFLLLLLFF